MYVWGHLCVRVDVCVRVHVWESRSMCVSVYVCVRVHLCKSLCMCKGTCEWGLSLFLVAPLHLPAHTCTLTHFYVDTRTRARTFTKVHSNLSSRRRGAKRKRDSNTERRRERETEQHRGAKIYCLSPFSREMVREFVTDGSVRDRCPSSLFAPLCCSVLPISFLLHLSFVTYRGDRQYPKEIGNMCCWLYMSRTICHEGDRQYVRKNHKKHQKMHVVDIWYCVHTRICTHTHAHAHEDTHARAPKCCRHTLCVGAI